MSDYGVREKKIVFYDSDKRHADLKIRLQYDDLTQVDFFQSLMTGYINKDERITSYLYEWKELNKSYSKKKRKKSEKLLRDGKEIETKFGLNEGEIENIFDLLEQEHSDL